MLSAIDVIQNQVSRFKDWIRHHNHHQFVRRHPSRDFDGVTLLRVDERSSDSFIGCDDFIQLRKRKWRKKRDRLLVSKAEFDFHISTE